MSCCWSTALDRAVTARCARPEDLTRPSIASGRTTPMARSCFCSSFRLCAATASASLGWSQGGGVTLFCDRIASIWAGPPRSPEHDFRAAVAFYPGACNERRHPADWTTGIPLLVLIGAAGRLDAAGALQDLSRRRHRARQPGRFRRVPWGLSRFRCTEQSAARAAGLQNPRRSSADYRDRPGRARRRFAPRSDLPRSLSEGLIQARPEERTISMPESTSCKVRLRRLISANSRIRQPVAPTVI